VVTRFFLYRPVTDAVRIAPLTTVLTAFRAEAHFSWTTMTADLGMALAELAEKGPTKS
jgi:hypothetical protein